MPRLAYAAHSIWFFLWTVVIYPTLQFSTETQDAVDAITTNTEELCQCSITRDHIIDPVFLCFGVEANDVTFRAQILANSQSDTSEIISYMEQWIDGGSAVVNIDNILYTPDPSCVVRIQSLNDPECEQRSSSLAVGASMYGVLTAVMTIALAFLGI